MTNLLPLIANPQVITIAVLVAVVAALIWDKARSDVVALAGAAVLLLTGVVRPIQVQSAFPVRRSSPSPPCSSLPTQWNSRACSTPGSAASSPSAAGSGARGCGS